MAVSGNLVYVAGFSSGLRVIDVANPQAPQEVGYYVLPERALRVAVAGNYAYVADNSAGLQIVEFYGVGIQESPKPQASSSKPGATIVSSILLLPKSQAPDPKSQTELLDAAGRKVMALRPGPNDVSRLPSGVYFVRRNAVNGGRNAADVQKVVLAR